MEEKKIYELSIEELNEISKISETDSLGKVDDTSGEHRRSHHHYSHRHHHGKHSRRHSKNSKKHNSFLKFLQKNKSTLINIVACSISVVLLILLALSWDNRQENSIQQNIMDITQSSIKVESSIYTDKVPLVSEAILTYMDKSDVKTPREISKMFGGNIQKLSYGLPLVYTYMVSGLPSGVTVEKAVLELSENESFDNLAIYNLDTNGDNIEIYNLKPDTGYHYKLRLTLSTGTEIGTTGEFTTVASPRILNIEGAVNMRDIGGWDTVYGKKIKYGLLYRGSELDGAVEPNYLLTEKGQSDMLLTLGIRFDMDLRGAHESDAHPLGANVLHKFYGIPMYSYIFNEAENEKVRSIFSDLANKDNYPIYMHCTYGVDRTGTICYLLEAMLGVSDEDLHCEYELSAFKDFVNPEEFAAFVTRIGMREGDTTKEKVEGYLLSIGVTEEEIESIRNIFLG